MRCRNRSFFLSSCVSAACFYFLMPTTWGEALELAPSSSLITQKFLADRQKPETPSALPCLSSSDNSFAPFFIILSPEIKMSPLPKWAGAPVQIHKEAGSVEIPIPALAEQSEIENLALTINFYDMGDGGPLVEGMKKDGERFLICSGLGINGPALGLNSRTIVIPSDLALDGGKVIVSHTGRFEQLHSLILRPGRTAMVSVLNGSLTPAIIDGTFLIDQESANGATPVFKKGCTTHDRITCAELSAPIEQLSDTLEFAFDITGQPEATIFRTDLQGLDLESHIDVELNGTVVGPLNVASFSLDAAELIFTPTNDPHISSLQFAGWRSGYVTIPTSLWKEKKSGNEENKSTDEQNHLVLRVKPGACSSGSKIHLKNSCLEILHDLTPEQKK